jgi:CRP-like cAMP-binding protein
VKVSSFSEEGHETVLGFRGAGDVPGELAAIDGEEHLANVTVVEAGKALVLPAERFLAALQEQQGLALVLLRSIVGRLRDADRKRAEFTACLPRPSVRTPTSVLASRGEPRERIRLPPRCARGPIRALAAFRASSGACSTGIPFMTWPERRQPEPRAGARPIRHRVGCAISRAR